MPGRKTRYIKFRNTERLNSTPMNILLKLIIWFLELLAALIIALGFLIFFFSFKRDDDTARYNRTI